MADAPMGQMLYAVRMIHEYLTLRLRRAGHTFSAIKSAAETGAVLVVTNRPAQRAAEHEAKRMGADLRRAVTVQDFAERMQGCYGPVVFDPDAVCEIIRIYEFERTALLRRINELEAERARKEL